jgi:hypothetical protein
VHRAQPASHRALAAAAAAADPAAADADPAAADLAADNPADDDPTDDDDRPVATALLLLLLLTTVRGAVVLDPLYKLKLYRYRVSHMTGIHYQNPGFSDSMSEISDSGGCQ